MFEKKLSVKAEPSAVQTYSGYESDADAGFENADASAYSIPRLYMLQPLSPQVEKGGPEYIEGAEAGMMYDSVNKKFYSKLYVVPCLYRRTFVEWIPRKQGGGFVEEHLSIDPDWKRASGGPYLTAEGNEVNDTRNFVLLASTSLDGQGVPVDPIGIVLSLTSTQIRRATDWMTVMGQKKGSRPDGSKFQIPMFANVFELSREYQSNEKGSWYGWKIVDTGGMLPVDNPVYQQAKAFRADVERGTATVEAPAETETTIPTDSKM